MKWHITEDGLMERECALSQLLTADGGVNRTCQDPAMDKEQITIAVSLYSEAISHNCSDIQNKEERSKTNCH